MNEFLQLDIFFFVATMAVVLITAVTVVFALYLIRIARSIDRIASVAREKTEVIGQDLDELRTDLKRSGFRWAHFLRFAKNLTKRGKVVNNLSAIRRQERKTMAKSNRVPGGALTVAALAAAAAGAYYFYGKDGSKHRKQLRGWAVKAQGEVMEQMENLSDVSRESYNRVIAEVLKKYKTVKKATPKELAMLASELRGHWGSISQELDRLSKQSAPATRKPAAKSKRKRK